MAGVKAYIKTGGTLQESVCPIHSLLRALSVTCQCHQTPMACLHLLFCCQTSQLSFEKNMFLLCYFVIGYGICN